MLGALRLDRQGRDERGIAVIDNCVDNDGRRVFSHRMVLYSGRLGSCTAHVRSSMGRNGLYDDFRDDSRLFSLESGYSPSRSQQSQHLHEPGADQCLLDRRSFLRLEHDLGPVYRDRPGHCRRVYGDTWQREKSD